MRVNESISISTHNVLLVPYEAQHVPTYHSWMQDPEILEATASERMTLEEEYSNQQSWRHSHDKLTFILLDLSSNMIGDVNFFLHPDPDADALVGEVDIMIAHHPSRRNGIGSSAVLALLTFVTHHHAAMLEEYAAGERVSLENVRLGRVMAKIKARNEGSTRLFEKLGFVPDGNGVNYFGEATFVAEWPFSPPFTINYVETHTPSNP